MKPIDLESFSRLLRELEDYTLIVEGKKDERALKTLGLRNIIPINGRPLAAVADRLDDKRQIVILTDFDAEGKRIAARLLRLLQRRRIKTNPRLRRMMHETGITQIEGMAASSAAAFIKEKGDTYGEIGANFYEVYSKGKYKGKRHC